MTMGQPDETPEDYRIWSHKREQERANAAREALPVAQAVYNAAVTHQGAVLRRLDEASREALRWARVVGDHRIAKKPVPEDVLTAQREADALVLRLRDDREAAKRSVAEAKHALDNAMLAVSWRETSMGEDEEAMLGITRYVEGFGPRGRTGRPCAHKHCRRYPDQHERDGFRDPVCPVRAPVQGRPTG